MQIPLGLHWYQHLIAEGLEVLLHQFSVSAMAAYAEVVPVTGGIGLTGSSAGFSDPSEGLAGSLTGGVEAT